MYASHFTDTFTPQFEPPHASVFPGGGLGGGPGICAQAHAAHAAIANNKILAVIFLLG
jgi:hypothetical protein